jgi:hypothetical protein
MSVRLTEEEFAKHLHTKFRVRLELPEPVELELVEVRGRPSGPGEQQGMERFSAFFRGPSHVRLNQHTFPLAHDRMGEFELFLVPVGQESAGLLYEAVFNYFKDE